MVRRCPIFKVSVITLISLQTMYGLPVFAAGFALSEMSPGLQGSAMAGAAAATDDVSSLFINPATLSTLKHHQIYLGGSQIMPHVQVTSASAIHAVNVPGSPPSSISAPVSGVSSQRNIAKSAFVPDGFFGYRLNDIAVVGLAITVPYGLTTKYYGDSVLRYAAVTSAVKSINFTPAISFKANEKWSFGVGFQAQHLNATFTNFNGPYTSSAAVNSLISATSPTYETASGWGYGYNVGALYQLDPKTQIGLGYRSQISTQVSGTGQQMTSPGPVVPAPSQDFLFNAQTSVNGSIKTPASAMLSATREMNDWTVKASVQMTFWDAFNQLTINTPNAFATTGTIHSGWSNTWFGSVGADYRYNSDVTLRGGLAYDQTPTKDKFRDPRIPDADRYWVTMGATYAVTKNFSIDGAYEHLFSPTQSVNVTQAAGSSAVNPGPLEVNQVNARYKSSVDIVAVAARYSF
jgi:long-chain fatty acid transport protein